MADQDASSMADQINLMNDVEVSEDEEIETDEEEVVNDDSDAADEDTNSDDSSDFDEDNIDEEDIEDEESDEDETDEDVEESDEGEEDSEDEEESETELTLAQNRITQLTELIESQALNQLTGVKVDKKTPEKQPGEQEETSDDTPPLDLAEIVGDLDLTDLAESPDKLVELLGKVINLTRQQTAADFASQLPKMVNKQATSVVDMHTLVGNFYRDNKDLSEVKQVVTAVAQSVGVENPEWDMTKVLVESAKRARKMLGISEKTTKPKARKKVKRSGKKPAVPKKAKGKRKVASKKLTDMQKQINEMNSLT